MKMPECWQTSCFLHVQCSPCAMMDGHTHTVQYVITTAMFSILRRRPKLLLWTVPMKSMSNLCQGRPPLLTDQPIHISVLPMWIGWTDIGPPCSPWCTTQLSGAQCRSVVHNIVLYPWDDAQHSSRAPPHTHMGQILLPRLRTPEIKGQKKL